jgi:hypothetical protein
VKLCVLFKPCADRLRSRQPLFALEITRRGTSLHSTRHLPAHTLAIRRRLLGSPTPWVNASDASGPTELPYDPGRHLLDATWARA